MIMISTEPNESLLSYLVELWVWKTVLVKHVGGVVWTQQPASHTLLIGQFLSKLNLYTLKLWFCHTKCAVICFDKLCATSTCCVTANVCVCLCWWGDAFFSLDEWNVEFLLQHSLQDTRTWLVLLLASFERSFFSRSWMRASLEPWMSSSVEREEEGRGATDFFRMGLGRLEDRDRDKRGEEHKSKRAQKESKDYEGKNSY